MSRTSSVIEIVATASKLLTDISDTPVLSPLKPIGVTLLAICEHVAALKGNQEAALMLAERLNRVVRALANRPQDFEGDMAGNYLEDVKTLEHVLVKIATTLQDQRQKWWSRFSPKTRASELSNLSSELDYAISIFGLSADFEARQAFQAVRTLASKELNLLELSELYCPTISLSHLRTYRELNATNNYSVQVGTYQNQAVVVKKYYAKRDKIFEKDLRQRLNQTHPGIACVIGSAAKVAIMMLCAEGIMFCQDDLFDLESVRRPWQQREIVLTKEDVDSRSPSTGVAPRNPSQNRDEVIPKPMPGLFLAIKKSDVLLRQFNSIIQFLTKMDVKVAWWDFKPSWTGLRGGKHIVLMDWAEDTTLKQENDFEPQYAIHVIGLGFSYLAPNVFRDSGRLLAAGASTGPEANSHPNEQGELNEHDERAYCYCDRVSYGEMIGCDGDYCTREWFHIGCVGLTSIYIPASWFCADCSSNAA